MSVLNLSVEELVSKTSDLPALPSAAIQVMKEADASSGTAQSVAQYLSYDQSLTARVLRLANSAYYGLSRKVKDPQEAVVVLGMRCVRSLAVIAATYPFLSRPLQGYGVSPEQMWRHSFAVGVGAQLIAATQRTAAPEAAFTAGLLHNIGKVALSVWLENKVVGMKEIAERAQVGFDQLERQLLGHDHAEIGGYLAESWNLPTAIVEPIRFHHRPSDCPTFQEISDCVHVADYIAMQCEVGYSGEWPCYTFDESALVRQGISPEGLDSLREEFLSIFHRHEQMFSEAA